MYLRTLIIHCLLVMSFTGLFDLCLHKKQLLILCIALGYSLLSCDPLQFIGLVFVCGFRSVVNVNTYVQ